MGRRWGDAGEAWLKRNVPRETAHDFKPNVEIDKSRGVGVEKEQGAVDGGGKRSWGDDGMSWVKKTSAE